MGHFLRNVGYNKDLLHEMQGIQNIIEDVSDFGVDAREARLYKEGTFDEKNYYEMTLEEIGKRGVPRDPIKKRGRIGRGKRKRKKKKK